MCIIFKFNVLPGIETVNPTGNNSSTLEFGTKFSCCRDGLHIKTTHTAAYSKINAIVQTDTFEKEKWQGVINSSAQTSNFP